MQFSGTGETRAGLRVLKNRRLRNGYGVLHGMRRPLLTGGSVSGKAGQLARRMSNTSGSVLVEVLMSLSIMTIGILAVAAGGRVVRNQAELASRRAAEALAAQQVLEQGIVGIPGDSSRIDTVSIGVHQVRVRIESRDSLSGLTWIRVQADAGAGSVPWELETLRRIP